MSATDNVEIIKLGRELDIPPAQLAFLDSVPARDLVDLRVALCEAMFRRQEPRFRRIAAATRLLPNAVLAKGAQFAIGAKISAWVAGVLDPDAAIKLAGALDTDFLTQVSRWLDPQRATAIVTALPTPRVIRIGKGLLDLHEYIPLGRYLLVVNADVVLGVMALATDEQLLEVARFIDAPETLDARQTTVLAEVIERLDPVRAERLRNSLSAQLTGPMAPAVD